MRPKAWDDLELKIAGALDGNPVKISDLEGPELKLFSREKWHCTDHEYKTLLPSMRFASKLIQVGMPFIASFLPSDRIFDMLQEQAQKIELKSEKDGEDEIMDDIDDFSSERPFRPTYNTVIDLKDDLEDSDIKTAREGLDTITDFAIWEVNNDIYSTLNAWGLNILTPQPRPWTLETAEMIDENDQRLKHRNQPHREVIIGIAGEYINVINTTPSNTEQHLRAVWHAGITMAHEIAHVVFNHDLRWNPADSVNYRAHSMLPRGEPFLGDECRAELGNSFISYIFSGCTPDTIGAGPDCWKFEQPLMWRRTRRMQDFKKKGKEERPFYEAFPSISNACLERTLSQSFWDRLKNHTGSEFSRKAIEALAPFLGPSQVAMAVVRDFDYDGYERTWRAVGHDRTPQPNTLMELSQTECDMVLEEKKAEKERRQYAQEERLLSGDPVDAEKPLIINDGVVMPDIFDSHYDIMDFFNNKVTRVEVVLWYPKRDAQFSDFDQNVDYRRFRRFKNYEGELKRMEENIRGLDSRALVEDATIPFIQNRFTHLAAYKYLKKAGISIVLTRYPSRSWEDSYLDNELDDDQEIILAIQRHLWEQALNKFKTENDVQGLLLLFYNIVQSNDVHNWDTSMLQRFYARGNTHESKAIMAETIQKTMELALANYFPRQTFDPLLAEWDAEELRLFFRARFLPEWGTYPTLLERYYAYKYQERLGHPRKREEMAHRRLNHSGSESYVFYIDMEHTSVEALKDVLYRKALLPAYCNLNLRRRKGGETLDDLDALSRHLADYEPLVLEVESWPFGTNPAQPRRQRVPQPPIWHNGNLALQFKKETRKAAREKDAELAETWQPPKLNLARRMAAIAANAKSLDKAMARIDPDASLKPGIPLAPMSAEDLAYRLEEESRFLERMGYGEDGYSVSVPKTYDSEEDEEEEVIESHMAHLLRQVRGGVGRKRYIRPGYVLGPGAMV